MRLWPLVAALCVLCTVILALGGKGASAASGGYAGSTQGVTSREADPNTMDTYIDQLLGGGTGGGNGSGTRYAGRVWSDKTVFANGAASAYVVGDSAVESANPWNAEKNTLTLDEATDGVSGTISTNEDFLHVFSALGSSQEVSETVPLDVMFVIDISTSMGDVPEDVWSKHKGEDWNEYTGEEIERDNNELGIRKDMISLRKEVPDARILKTLDALNGAMNTLLDISPKSRVGLAAYGAGATIVLPLKNYDRGENHNYTFVDLASFTIKSDEEMEKYPNTGGFKYSDVPEKIRTYSDESPVTETYLFDACLYDSDEWNGCAHFAINAHGDTNNPDVTTNRVGNYYPSKDESVVRPGDKEDNWHSTEQEHIGPTDGVNDSGEVSKYVIRYCLGATTNLEAGNYVGMRALAEAKNTTYKTRTGGTVSRTPALIVMTDGAANMLSYCDEEVRPGVERGDYRYSWSCPDPTMTKAAVSVSSASSGQPGNTSSIIVQTLMSAAYMKTAVQEHYTREIKNVVPDADPVKLRVEGVGLEMQSEDPYIARATMDPKDYFPADWGRDESSYPSDLGEPTWIRGQYSDDGYLYEWHENELEGGTDDGDVKRWGWYAETGESDEYGKKVAIQCYYKEGVAWCNWKDCNTNGKNKDYESYISEYEEKWDDYYNNYSFEIGKFPLDNKDSNKDGVTVKGMAENIQYVDAYHGVESADIGGVFRGLIESLAQAQTVPVSGTNDLGAENSISYVDPIGIGMEIKNPYTSNAESEAKADMEMALNGHLYGVNRSAVYDYQWNAARTDFENGWYQGYEASSATYSEERPADCATDRDAWAAGWVYRIDRNTVIDFVPTLKGDDGANQEKRQNTVYTVYSVKTEYGAELDAAARDATIHNPSYPGTAEDEEALGNYKLSDIRIWEEDTGDWQDRYEGDLVQDAGYDDALYADIPSAALPLQKATVALLSGDSATYTNNLSRHAESTPLRLFYHVGTDSRYLYDSGNVDVSSLDKTYVDSHTDSDGRIWFNANYYSGAEDSAGATTVGNAGTTFSPAKTNRYYVFQENLPLYAIPGKDTPKTGIKLGSDAIKDGKLSVDGKECPLVTSVDSNESTKNAVKEDGTGVLCSDGWYYLVVDYYEEGGSGAAVPKRIAIARQGSQFGSAIEAGGGAFGEYLCWCKPGAEGAEGEALEPPTIAESAAGTGEAPADSYVATKVGGLRVGSLQDQILPKKKNVTGTSETRYAPSVSNAGGAAEDGFDLVLNAHLGNNGVERLSSTNVVATKLVYGEDGKPVVSTGGSGDDTASQQVFDYQVFIDGFTGRHDAIVVEWDEFAELWRQRIASLDVLTSNGGLLISPDDSKPVLVNVTGDRYDDLTGSEVTPADNGNYYVYFQIDGATGDTVPVYRAANNTKDEDSLGGLTSYVDAGSVSKVGALNEAAKAEGSNARYAYSESVDPGTRVFWVDSDGEGVSDDVKVYLIPKREIEGDAADWKPEGALPVGSLSVTHFQIATLNINHDEGLRSGITLDSPYAIRASYLTKPVYFGYKTNDEGAGTSTPLAAGDLFDPNDLTSVRDPSEEATRAYYTAEQMVSHTAQFTLKSGEGLLFPGAPSRTNFRVTEAMNASTAEKFDLKQARAVQFQNYAAYVQDANELVECGLDGNRKMEGYIAEGDASDHAQDPVGRGSAKVGAYADFENVRASEDSPYTGEVTGLTLVTDPAKLVTTNVNNAAFFGKNATKNTEFYSVYSDTDVLEKGAQFENMPFPVRELTASLTVTKEMAEGASSTDAFEFTATFKDAKGEPLEDDIAFEIMPATLAGGDDAKSQIVSPTPSGGSGEPLREGTITLPEGVNGTVTFKLVPGAKVTFFGLPMGSSYELEETGPAGYTPDWTHRIGKFSTAETDITATAVNTSVPPETGDLKISKKLAGELTDADQARQWHFDVTLTKDGKPLEGTFGDVPFDDQGRATVVLEGGQSLTISGIPEGTKYTVEEREKNEGHFTTTPENGRIEGSVTADVIADAEFTNTKAAADLIKPLVRIEKTIAGSGASIEGHKFKFEVKPDSNNDPATDPLGGKPKVVETTGHADPSGDGTTETVTLFYERDFSASGTYTYTVSEVRGNDPAISYDGREFTVTVTITDGAHDEDLNTRELLASVTVTDAKTGKQLAAGGSGSTAKEVQVSFENVYDIKQITVPLRAHKTLEGKDLEADAFTFELSAQDGAPLPGGATGSIQAKNLATGDVLFDGITFNKAGTYKYTIREVVPEESEKAPYTTYDEGVWDVTVAVEAHANNGLSAKVTYERHSEETAATHPEANSKAAEFVNSYEPPTPPPPPDGGTPALAVSKTHGLNDDAFEHSHTLVNEVAGGDVVTYFVKVENTGSARATDVTVRDVVPEGLELVGNSISEGGSIGSDGRTITWSLGTLGAGESRVVSFAARVPTVDAETTWTNVASAWAEEVPDPKATNVVMEHATPPENPPGEPDEPDEPDNPPDTPPDNPSNPGTPDTPSTPGTPGAPSDPKNPEMAIPKTGDDRPISLALLLGAAGVSLLAATLVLLLRRRRA